jgi:hypothetical protein
LEERGYAFSGRAFQGRVDNRSYGSYCHAVFLFLAVGGDLGSQGRFLGVVVVFSNFFNERIESMASDLSIEELVEEGGSVLGIEKIYHVLSVSIAAIGVLVMPMFVIETCNGADEAFTVGNEGSLYV